MIYYFTWGFGQGHDNCYTTIDAETSNEAREIMFAMWGERWGFQYDSAEEAGVDRWNLQYEETKLKEEPDAASNGGTG